jgi:hypothetical protein
MVSAAVLWLLVLAGPPRRGMALGHIGLANYAGLTVGPLWPRRWEWRRRPTGCGWRRRFCRRRRCS